jgi:c-di-GMP-binding flagellar brake protein YcgR
MTWISNLRQLLPWSKPRPERRLYPRYRMQLEVTVEADGRKYRARSSDLSQSGIGVYLTVDLEIGSQVTLTYQLGDGSEPKTVRAIVRNRIEGRYGLEFCG